MTSRAPCRRLALAVAVLLCPLGWSLGRAVEPRPADTALGKVPADVEAFSTSLRLGETFATIAKSRAWQQVWNEPAVQDLWKKARSAYDADKGDWAPIKKFFQAPANQDLPGLAADAFSHEFFVYAGPGWGEKIALIQKVYGAAFYKGLSQKNLSKEDENTVQIRIVLQALSKKPETLDVSNLVLGFKVSDAAKVQEQLKRLEPLLTEALKDTPLKGHGVWKKIGSDEFLVLELDSALVPWDELALDKYEEKPGEFAPLLKRLKAQKLAVALGVRQGYLLVGLGASADHLAQFGGEGPKLAGLPEMKPLAQYANRSLLAVSYVSRKLLEPLATTSEDLAGMVEMAKAGLEKADLSDDLRKAIEKDVDALARSFSHDLEKPGSVTSFSVRTPSGWETFTRDYTATGPRDARPLTLLNHLGGNPLMAAVGRSDHTVKDYRAFVRWVSIFAGHAEKALIEKVPQAEEGVKLFQTQFVPLLQDLSDVTEKLWFPALADGQEAFVLDAKWTSKRWYTAMPESDKPLPMFEPALVLGVSDAAKLEEALEAYRVAINKMIAKVHDLAPTVPDLVIPKPQVETKGGNTFAHYPIPEVLGLDAQFQPTGGLSAKVAVLALSRDHAERLLKDNPLKTGTAPLANLKRPLDSAFYLNWSGLVDAVAPWIEYAMKQRPADDAGEEPARIARKVIGLLKVFQSYTSATYREGGATLTHSEMVFRDVEPVGK